MTVGRGSLNPRVSAGVADVTQRYVQTAIERYGGMAVFFANAGVEGVVGITAAGGRAAGAFPLASNESGMAAGRRSATFPAS